MMGFTDATPSESIQSHEYPGLAVVSLFPTKKDEIILDVPIKQFKDVTKLKKKIVAAQTLTEWLASKKKEGLRIEGFCLTQTQLVAANYGMSVIEGIPNIEVRPHYNTFRLYFGEYHIDFAQAVALAYYMFSAFFACLTPSLRLRKLGLPAELIMYMDRFPGKEAKGAMFLPETDGSRFVDFIRSNSPTYAEIEKDHNGHSISVELKPLGFWLSQQSNIPHPGKEHPHFKLVDWMAQSAIATSYRGEFIAKYGQQAKAAILADKMEELYSTFKTFNILSLEENLMQHLTAGERCWNIPDDARRFIVDRASR